MLFKTQIMVLKYVAVNNFRRRYFLVQNVEYKRVQEKPSRVEIVSLTRQSTSLDLRYHL